MKKKVLGVVLCLFVLSVSNALAQLCDGDFNYDGDVDGTDAFQLKEDFGRKNCTNAPAPVPKTGQTTCYDNSGNPRDCAGTGEDGEYRKGVASPNPRFTDHANGTVTDRLTGLMWFKNANCIATNYPSFDNDGTAGDGAVRWQHALDFVAGINDGTYINCSSGYYDWRLPNVREIQSLIDYGVVNPALPSGHPFTNVSLSSDYWSSTTYLDDPSGTWVVFFLYGSVGVGYKSDPSYYTWAVRAGQ